jgi:hypothetical protein
MLIAIRRDRNVEDGSLGSSEVQTLRAKEPMKTPGHARLPKSRSPARAMPEGGQTAVA